MTYYYFSMFSTSIFQTPPCLNQNYIYKIFQGDIAHYFSFYDEICTLTVLILIGYFISIILKQSYIRV